MASKKIYSRKKREFEVERIVGDKYVGNKRFFFIKWKNFPSSQNTWEPEKNLSKCSSLIREYYNGKGLRNSKSHNLNTVLRSLKVSEPRRSSISSLISISSSKSCRQLTVRIKPVDISVYRKENKLNADRRPKKSHESSVLNSNSPRVQLVRMNLPETVPKVVLQSSDHSPKRESPNEFIVPSHSRERTWLSDSSDVSLKIQLSDESVNDHVLDDSRISNRSPKLGLTTVLSSVSSQVSVDSKIVEATQMVSFLPDVDESSPKETNESEIGDKIQQNFVPTNSNIDPIRLPSTSIELEPNAKITKRSFDQTPRPAVFSAPPVLNKNLDEIADSDEDLLSISVFFENSDDEEKTKKKSKKRKQKKY